VGDPAAVLIPTVYIVLGSVTLVWLSTILFGVYIWPGGLEPLEVACTPRFIELAEVL